MVNIGNLNSKKKWEYNDDQGVVAAWCPTDNDLNSLQSKKSASGRKKKAKSKRKKSRKKHRKSSSKTHKKKHRK